MRVGDLIVDQHENAHGIILELYPFWIDSSGNKHTWDFKILVNGKTFFVDREDIKSVIPGER